MRRIISKKKRVKEIIMKSLMLLLVFLTTHVQGMYIVKVKTDSYINILGNRCYGCQNTDGSSGDGTFKGCCDNFGLTTCTGTDRCDNYFHYCLFQPGTQPSFSLLSTCPGGMISNVNTDGANIDFSTPTVLGLTNPILLEGPGLWSGIQLYIEVGDEDVSSTDELVDQFVIEIPSSLSVGNVINRNTYNGSRGFSQIDITIEVVCDDDYTGLNCDVLKSSIDCSGNGQVAADATCMCTQGYTGDRCETDIDECAFNPCGNNGQCIQGTGTFSCDCNPGFTGQLCEIDIDDCIRVDCNGNGFCSDGINTYSCICNVGYTGAQCEINIDNCLGINCSGNGQCRNGFNNFTCDCMPGYNGRLCQLIVNEVSITQMPNNETLLGSTHLSDQDGNLLPILGGSLGGTILVTLIVFTIMLLVGIKVYRRSPCATEKKGKGNIEAESRYSTGPGELGEEPIYESIPASYDRTRHFRPNVMEYDFFENAVYSEADYNALDFPSNQSAAVPLSQENSKIYEEVL